LKHRESMGNPLYRESSRTPLKNLVDAVHRTLGASQGGSSDAGSVRSAGSGDSNRLASDMEALLQKLSVQLGYQGNSEATSNASVRQSSREPRARSNTPLNASLNAPGGPVLRQSQHRRNPSQGQGQTLSTGSGAVPQMTPGGGFTVNPETAQPVQRNSYMPAGETTPLGERRSMLPGQRPQQERATSIQLSMGQSTGGSLSVSSQASHQPSPQQQSVVPIPQRQSFVPGQQQQPGAANQRSGQSPRPSVQREALSGFARPQHLNPGAAQQAQQAALLQHAAQQAGKRPV